MKKTLLLLAAGTLLVTANASAQIDYTAPPVITNAVTLSGVRDAAGETGNDTFGVESVTAGPAGVLYISHGSPSFADKIVEWNLGSNSGTFLVNVDTDEPGDDGNTGDVRYTGAFRYDLTRDELYIADFQDGNPAGAQTTLMGIDAGTGTVRNIASSLDLEGTDGFDLLDTDTMIVYREAGNGGDNSVWAVDLGTGALTGPLVTQADILALTGGASADLECGATDPNDGSFIVFDDVTKTLIRIADPTGTPVLTDITPAGAIDGLSQIRNMAVGPDGELILMDRGNLRLAIFDGTNTTLITEAEMITALGAGVGAFGAEDDNGMAFVVNSATSATVYLANRNATSASLTTFDNAIVAVTFGSPASVSDWTVY